MHGLPSSAALEDPIGHPLGGASEPLSPFQRVCPEGFRLAPALTEPLVVDLPPNVVVEVDVEELREAAELQHIAGVVVLSTSDVAMQVGTRYSRAKHGTARAVLFVGTCDCLRIETTHATLHSSIQLWPMELGRDGRL